MDGEEFITYINPLSMKVDAEWSDRERTARFAFSLSLLRSRAPTDGRTGRTGRVIFRN